MVALKVPVPFVIMVVGLVSSMPVILARKWLFSFSAATAITALMQSKARTANQSFFIVFLSLVVKKCQVSRIDLLRGDPRNLSLKNPAQGFWADKSFCTICSNSHMARVNFRRSRLASEYAGFRT